MIHECHCEPVKQASMSRELSRTLKDLRLERQIEAGAGKWEKVPEWAIRQFK